MQVDDTPHRIPELWFDDGSIIVQAGNSQFRVHRSILAACSPVFKDMLSFPQPADAELVEGCPVVHLPDAPEEVTVFLKAIFLPDYFMPFPAKTEFGMIRGCLRLGHKYGVEHLRLRAMIHFSSRFRTTLSQWDTSSCPYVYGESEFTGPWNLPQPQIISWLTLDTPTMCSCIQLAREVDAPWILPVAFYLLSHRLTQKSTMTLMEVIRGNLGNDATSHLSTQDQESFLYGHIRQTQFLTTSILGCFSEPVKILDCKWPVRCLEGRLSAVNSVRETFSAFPSMPLDVWGEDDWEEFAQRLCPSCLAFLRVKHQDTRREFWDDLPRMYGLPPWPELEKLRVAAIGTQWFPSELSL
ncbi:hypothetical protein FB45DRAFT_843338 [Roridomyces roridus]|uniref:BTB domain-containing protein n=1 Tax=Roridomyces roridus TaxID=1738132 RepID=A0AAD7B721_9AGAR|nr:hypothetical protein FB45DRAFT_843338 [Roridomyces roridus]